MAKDDNNTLIGHDPLAWMEEGDEEQVDENNTDQVVPSKNLLEKDAQESSIEEHTQEAVQQEEPNAEPEEGLVMLDSSLTIQNVEKLYEQLTEQLEKKVKVEVDASNVNSIDTSSLQCLIVLKQSAMKNGKELSIDFPTEKFIEAAELLGLSDLLEVDQAAAGFF